MRAIGLDKQVPAAAVFVNTDAVMGDLPQQMFEILFGSWRRSQCLGDICTALGARAPAAFIVCDD